MIYAANVGGDGRVLAAFAVPEADLELQELPEGASRVILTPELYQQLGGAPGTWRVSEAGKLEPMLQPEPPIEQVRASAMAQVDQAAERARLRWITPGAGQAMEYLQTEGEARAYLAAGAPAEPAAGLYPFLRAEQEASAEAGLPAASFTAIAERVVLAADAWAAAGAAIKALRRTAKMRIELAETAEEAWAIAGEISWPAP
jgi:hypothetical protein